jgi:hypothetical protein
MTPEQEEYLEQEYSHFEETYLHGERFWRAPISALKDTALFLYFQLLCDLFPDHPSEYNTLFYLLESTSGDHSVLMVCTHFEHGSLSDVKGLMDFFGRHAASLVCKGSIELIALELLDQRGEKLHVRFYNPVSGVIGLLKQHATRKPV